MSKHRVAAWIFLPVVFILGSCSSAPKPLDDSRLRDTDQETSNWLMYGRTYDDHRFSPLNQINEQTVGKLGLAWSRELGTTRGLEATPLVEDGVIYTTGTWSVVYAVDAKTGEIRWTYDPKVPRENALFHLLRRGQSRRGTLQRQGVCGDARRPPDRSRREYWHARVDRIDHPHRPRQHTRSPARRASPRGW